MDDVNIAVLMHVFRKKRYAKDAAIVSDVKTVRIYQQEDVRSEKN